MVGRKKIRKEGVIQVLLGICLEEPKLLIQQPTRLCDYRIYSYKPPTSLVLHLYSSYPVWISSRTPVTIIVSSWFSSVPSGPRLDVSIKPGR